MAQAASGSALLLILHAVDLGVCSREGLNAPPTPLPTNIFQYRGMERVFELHPLKRCGE
jgi:hypothetical protein